MKVTWRKLLTKQTQRFLKLQTDYEPVTLLSFYFLIRVDLQCCANFQFMLYSIVTQSLSLSLSHTHTRLGHTYIHKGHYVCVCVCIYIYIYIYSMYIYILFLTLSFIMFYPKRMDIVPDIAQQDLNAYPLSKCNSLHLLFPNSQFIPLPPPSPLATTSLSSMSVSLFLSNSPFYLSCFDLGFCHLLPNVY